MLPQSMCEKAFENNKIDSKQFPNTLIRIEEIKTNCKTEKYKDHNTFAVSETSPGYNQCRQRERRPDRPVYIPRARRSQTTPPKTNLGEAQVIDSHICNVLKPEDLDLKLHQQAEHKSVTLPQASQNSTCNQNETQKKLVVNCHLYKKRFSVSDKDAKKNYKKFNKPEKDMNNCKEYLEKTDLKSKHQGKIQEYKDEFESNFKANSIDNLQLSNVIISSTEGKMNTISKIDGANNILKVESEADKNKKEEEKTLKPSLNVKESNRNTLDNSKNLSKPDPKDDWESMYDDNGDCLYPVLLKELTLAVGKVEIDKPKTNLSLYQNKQEILSEEEYPHVLEVSNFPVEFKTHDLMMIFSDYRESGFEIKWVDDSHALVVFSSSKVAAEVLSSRHPFVCLKPLAEATAESRNKAKRCSNSLQPYRPRPETCAALARRLVTGALGVRLKTSRQELENERRVLQAAKERKLLAAKQQNEVWEN